MSSTWRINEFVDWDTDKDSRQYLELCSKNKTILKEELEWRAGRKVDARGMSEEGKTDLLHVLSWCLDFSR